MVGLGWVVVRENCYLVRDSGDHAALDFFTVPGVIEIALLGRTVLCVFEMIRWDSSVWP